MSLLEVSNLKFRYADEELYNDLDFRLFEGEHAVLVGQNGTGKSTLLKLLSKQLSPDKGSIKWVNHINVGYLDQYAQIDQELLVKTYIYDVFLPLFEKEEYQQSLYDSLVSLPESEYDKILNRAAKITDELEAAGFYQIQSKIGNVLNGLGLGTEVLTTKISHLSGGMRAKLILAKLLLNESDVLLLDEPTNFLDVLHVEWLTKFLNNYPKTFIVISHDEQFIKGIATTVFALESKKLVRYKGNYNFYLKERLVRAEQHQKNFAAQQKFIAKTQDFINKNITRASTTKRAQSRRKMLEKVIKIDKPKINKKINFDFPLGVSTGIEVLKLKNLEIGYENSLIDPINFIIRKGEKIAITGKNGIGKSTLLKTVLKIIPAIAGAYQWIETAQIVYFEQDVTIDDKYTPFEIIHHDTPNLDKKAILSILANYGIDFEMSYRALSTLSGGQKAKVKFALMRNHKSNVLILDEPTNHLDFDAKESLKEALINYQGTLIIVSHEKEFYQEICDYEMVLENE